MDNAQLAAKFNKLEAKFHKLQIKCNELEQKIYLQGGPGTMGGAAQNASGGLAPQRQYQKADVGALTESHNQSEESPSIAAASISPDYPVSRPLELQQQMVTDDDMKTDRFVKLGVSRFTDTYTYLSDEGKPLDGKQFTVVVPDYEETNTGETDGSKDSYLRLGKANPEGWAYKDNESEAVQESDGWFDYTDGNHVSVTMGTRTDIISGGDYKQIINSGGVMTEDGAYLHQQWMRPVAAGFGVESYRRTTIGHISEDTYSFGDVEDYFFGYKADLVAGFTTDVMVGGSHDIYAGIGVNSSLSAIFNIGLSTEYNFIAGKKHTTSEAEDLKAREKITLRVKSSPEEKNRIAKFVKAHQTTIATVSTMLAGLIGYSIGATASPDGSPNEREAATSASVASPDDSPDGSPIEREAAISASVASWSMAMAAVFTMSKLDKSGKNNDAEIILDKKSIKLNVGNENDSNKLCSDITMEEHNLAITIGKVSGTPISQIKVDEDIIKLSTGSLLLLESAKKGNEKQFIALYDDGRIAVSAQDNKKVTIQNGSGNQIILLPSGKIVLNTKDLELMGGKVSIGKNKELTVG
jgi:hypothetical protein